MDGNGCVSECLSDAILVRRLDRVERYLGPDLHVRHNDIIRYHISKSPGVIGLLASEVQKTTKKKKEKKKKNNPPLKKNKPQTH